MNRMLKVVLDADDVLYKCNQKAVELLNEEYGSNYVLQDINKWGITDTLLDKRFKYFADPAFIAEIDVMDGAREFIKQLSKMAEIFICTNVQPQCASERYNAIVRDFPEIKKENIMIGGRKDLIKADVMLDDAIHNLLNANVEYPVLFQRPWNLENNSILSVSGYDEFLKLLLRIKNSFFSENGDYEVITVIGPAGSGKNNFVEKLLSENNKFEKIVSFSTKKDDENHYYMEKSDFEIVKSKGNFLETSIYLGEYYGIAKNQIRNVIKEGKVPVAIVDINGAMTISCMYSCLNVFVTASKEQCISRILVDSGLTDEEKIKRIISIDTEKRNQKLCDIVITEKDTDKILKIMEK